MSLFMERGVHQVERELLVLRLQRAAVRERPSVGYHSSPLWFLVGLEPSSSARIGHAEQHRQGHEDREGDLNPCVGYQVHVSPPLDGVREPARLVALVVESIEGHNGVGDAEAREVETSAGSRRCCHGALLALGSAVEKKILRQTALPLRREG